jgi:hypothetical protein
MYARDRFFHTQILHRSPDGKMRKMKQYSYELQSVLGKSYTTFYDVLVFENSKFVRTNCSALSNMISDWKPAHYAIEQHFDL